MTGEARDSSKILSHPRDIIKEWKTSHEGCPSLIEVQVFLSHICQTINQSLESDHFGRRWKDSQSILSQDICFFSNSQPRVMTPKESRKACSLTDPSKGNRWWAGHLVFQKEIFVSWNSQREACIGFFYQRICLQTLFQAKESMEAFWVNCLRSSQFVNTLQQLKGNRQEKDHLDKYNSNSKDIPREQ